MLSSGVDAWNPNAAGWPEVIKSKANILPAYDRGKHLVLVGWHHSKQDVMLGVSFSLEQ